MDWGGGGGRQKGEGGFPEPPACPPPPGLVAPGRGSPAHRGRHVPVPQESGGGPGTCPGPAVPQREGELTRPATEKPAPSLPPAGSSRPRPSAGSRRRPPPPQNPGGRRVGRRVGRGQRSGLGVPPAKPQPRVFRCQACSAPASPAAAESRGWGGRFPRWVLPLRPPPHSPGRGAPISATRYSPAVGPQHRRAPKGCFPKRGDPHQEPPPTWARGDGWPWQVCPHLAQLCCRVVKGWAAEQMRMGSRTGPLPA